jgi:hypothetical protein
MQFTDRLIKSKQALNNLQSLVAEVATTKKPVDRSAINRLFILKLYFKGLTN